MGCFGIETDNLHLTSPAACSTFAIFDLKVT